VEALRAFAAAQLPDFMVPKHFIPLPSLPLHPNGKVNRQALPEPEIDSPKSAEPARVPNEIEARLAKLWSEVLRVENVGVDDNFFQLGGHSLLALQLMARVRETFKADLPIKALFSSPTVAGLAQAISKAGSGGSPMRRIGRRTNEPELIINSLNRI
jgi:acyl carrier protein